MTNAVGWMILRNNQSKVINVLVEPYGLAYEMQPGNEFYIYFPSIEPDTPEIEYAESIISIYAFHVVIYSEGQEIHNYSNISITFPEA